MKKAIKKESAIVLEKNNKYWGFSIVKNTIKFDFGKLENAEVIYPNRLNTCSENMIKHFTKITKKKLLNAKPKDIKVITIYEIEETK
jgi:hypothetical protein